MMNQIRTKSYHTIQFFRENYSGRKNSIFTCPYDVGVSLVSQTVKNLPAMQETWVPSLSWEDPLKEDMTAHSSVLARRILMDRGAWQAIQSKGLQRMGHDWATKHIAH